MNFDPPIFLTGASHDELSGPDLRIRHVETTAVGVVTRMGGNLLGDDCAVLAQ